MKSNGNRYIQSKYLGKTKEIKPRKCIICNKTLSQTGRPNKRNVCSGCGNDCLKGQWGNLSRNINKSFLKKNKVKEAVEELKEDEELNEFLSVDNIILLCSRLDKIFGDFK